MRARGIYKGSSRQLALAATEGRRRERAAFYGGMATPLQTLNISTRLVSWQ